MVAEGEYWLITFCRVLLGDQHVRSLDVPHLCEGFVDDVGRIVPGREESTHLLGFVEEIFVVRARSAEAEEL